MEEDREDNKTLNQLSVEDSILILMYANKDRFLSGKLMLIKQMFLLTKEIVPQLFNRFNFYPSNYGPFSKILVIAIDKLIEKGYIKVKHHKNYYDNIIHNYILTDIGAKKAIISFNKLPEKIKEKIIMKRRIWDNLGYRGIIRLVYSKYPEYTIRSKIIDEVS